MTSSIIQNDDLWKSLEQPKNPNSSILTPDENDALRERNNYIQSKQ